MLFMIIGGELYKSCSIPWVLIIASKALTTLGCLSNLFMYLSWFDLFGLFEDSIIAGINLIFGVFRRFSRRDLMPSLRK